jgi:hypothetical protein
VGMTTTEHKFNKCPICKTDIRDRTVGEGCKGCLATEDEMLGAVTNYEPAPRENPKCSECQKNNSKYMRGNRMLCEECNNV